MTREEAKKIFEYLEERVNTQEPCDDAISRDAVLKIIDKWYENKSDIEDLIILITYMSSVTQKSGHWIYDETIENWRCSKCNETPKTMGYVGTADFMAEHFKFCNHCGAKMESEVNNG